MQNQIRLTRSRGVARAAESSAVGTASVAAPVLLPTDQSVLGLVEISGPSARLNEVRLHELSSEVLAASAEIAPRAGRAARDRDDRYA